MSVACALYDCCMCVCLRVCFSLAWFRLSCIRCCCNWFVLCVVVVLRLLYVCCSGVKRCFGVGFSLLCLSVAFFKTRQQGCFYGLLLFCGCCVFVVRFLCVIFVVLVCGVCCYCF